jgi:hypothetical protein
MVPKEVVELSAAARNKGDALAAALGEIRKSGGGSGVCLVACWMALITPIRSGINIMAARQKKSLIASRASPDYSPHTSTFGTSMSKSAKLCAGEKDGRDNGVFGRAQKLT